MDTIVNIFPSNFLAPITEANMLQVIVMALILGFAVILAGPKASPAIKAIDVANEVFMKAMDMKRTSTYGEMRAGLELQGFTCQ